MEYVLWQRCQNKVTSAARPLIRLVTIQTNPSLFDIPAETPKFSTPPHSMCLSGQGQGTRRFPHVFFPVFISGSAESEHDAPGKDMTSITQLIQMDTSQVDKTDLVQIFAKQKRKTTHPYQIHLLANVIMQHEHEQINRFNVVLLWFVANMEDMLQPE